MKIIPDVPRKVHDKNSICGSFLLEECIKSFPHSMIVINCASVLFMSFTILLGDVEIWFVSDRDHDLMRRDCSDRSCVEFYLPVFHSTCIKSPVLGLDAVEYDSTICNELMLSKICIAVGVEVSVDVQRFAIIIFMLLWIGSGSPTSFKNTICIHGCAAPHGSFRRNESRSHVHKCVAALFNSCVK